MNQVICVKSVKFSFSEIHVNCKICKMKVNIPVHVYAIIIL